LTQKHSNASVKKDFKTSNLKGHCPNAEQYAEMELSFGNSKNAMTKTHSVGTDATEFAKSNQVLIADFNNPVNAS
jgi:hypothetical protein